MADKDKIVGTDKFWDPEMIFTNYEPEEEEKDESIEDVIFGKGSAVLPSIETKAGPMPIVKEEGDVIIQWKTNEDGSKTPIPVQIGDPAQSEFYKKTTEIVNELNDIQLEPITAGIQYGKDFLEFQGFKDAEDIMLMDVDRTIAQVDKVLKDTPPVLVEKNKREYPAEIVTEPLTWEELQIIREGNKKRGIYGPITEADIGREGFVDERGEPIDATSIGEDLINPKEQKAFRDKYQDQISAIIDSGGNVAEAINKILYGNKITEERVALYNDVYSLQGITNKKEFDLLNSKIRGFIKKEQPDDTFDYEEIKEIDYLEDKFEVDPEAYEYVRDAIVKKFDFADYDNYEEYVDAVAQYTETLTAVDPLMQRTLINADLVLTNETNVKYLEMLDVARKSGALDDPNGLAKINDSYNKWQQDRYMELVDSSDYEARGLEYEFAVHQVLKDLYVSFGRSKDGRFKELDKELAEGKTSEWWYRIRNRASNSYTSFKQGLRGLAMMPRANKHAKINSDVNTLNNYAEDIEKYDLGELTAYQLTDWLNNNRGKDYLPEAKYTILKQKLLPLFDGRVNKVGGYETLNELNKNLNKELQDNIEYLGKSINANILDNERLSLVEKLGDDDSILGLVESIMDQSNMLFMFGGMALKQTKNPYAYGIGTILDAIGTADIVAKTMSGDMWAVLDGKIRAREGEGYIPTRDDYLAELEDPDSINALANMISTGAQVAGERFSLGKILKYGEVGRRRVASILRGQFKKYLYTVPMVLGASQLSGLQEYIVEGIQGLISDINQKYQIGGNRGTIFDAVKQGKFDFEEAKQAKKIGQVLPVAGAITNQTYIELTQISEIVVSRFNQNSNAAANEAFYKQALEKIRLDVKNNKISEEQGNEAIEIISHYRNIGLKIPKNLDGRKRERVVRLLVEKKKLEEEINRINDKDLTEDQRLRLAEVSAEVQLIIADTKAKEDYIKQVGNVLDIINESENSNVKVIRTRNAKGIENQRKKLNKEGWKIAASKGLSTNYGTIFQKGDQQVILLNDQEILKDGAINTAAHEFLHAVLWNTVKNSKGTALSLGNNLLEYLNEVDTSLLKNSELATRIQAYKDDPQVTNEQQAEEVLTLFSEALLNGAIAESAFDGTFGQRLGDLFTRILETLGFSSDIRFDTGRDVYKFIKNYNESIKKGKFTQAQQKLLTERATGKLVKREYTTQEMRDRDDAVQKSSKKLTELTKEYKEGNFDNVEDLSTQYQKTGKDALKRWAAQRGVSINLGNPRVNEEVTSLLNREFDSFTRNFDPSKAQASTYMENIAKRIGPKIVEEATRKGKQVSQDVLTEKGVSPEVSVQPDIDQKQEPTGQRAKVFPSSIKVIADNITGETRAEQIAMLKKDIQEGILRVGTNPKAVAKYIVEKTQTKEYRKLLKDKLGAFGSQQYIDNVNKLFNNTNFIKSIPVANIKRRFGKLFGIKQIGTTPTIKITDGKRTDFKKQVFKIPAISQAKLNEVKEYFLAGEKRHQSLMSLIGEGIAVEAMQELRADTQFMNELQSRLDFKKSNLSAQDFMQEVEFNLDKRNLEDTSLDVVKASKKRSQRSYSELGLQKIARSTMRQVGGQGSVFNYKNIKDSQKSTRRTGSIIMIHGFGKDTQGSYNYGKDGSIYKNEKEFEKDVFNTPLTEAEITLLEKFDIPLVTRRGKTYYDKSKAKNSFELGIDEQVMVKGKPKSVLQLARTEQRDYRKLTGSEARKRLKNKEFDELQKAKLRVLKKLAKRIESDLKIDPALKNYWAAWLNQSNDNILHPVRSLAPVEFFETREGKKVAEHTFPASQAATIIMNMAIEGKVNENFEFIDKDYFQGSILKTDDVKLIGEGYNYISNMPTIFFDIKNPSTWMRYVDIKVNKNNKGPININNIIVNKNGKVVTLAESFGLKLDNKNQTIDNIFDQNNLLFKIFTQELTIKQAKDRLQAAIKTNNKSSKQIINNKENLFPLINKNGTTDASIKAMRDADTTMNLGNKFSKKRKGISVFDFDDTLAYSNSKVIVTMPNQIAVYNASPKTFEELGKRTGLIFLATDIREAQEYAKMNRGKVKQFSINNSSLANETQVLDIMKQLGIDTSEGLLYEMIDPRFKNFYVGKKNVDKIKNVLRKRGFGGFTYTDGTQVVGGTTQSIAVINKSIIKQPIKITPAEFAVESENLLAQGAKFDFSEFNKVIKGRKGPLADLALKRQEKFGSGDIFVLTARPQVSAESIKIFLDGIGLNIPIENITGLQDGSSNAKALWVLDKTAQGYNDFYFADDSLPNVQAVKNILDQVDVKSKVQQAKANKKRDLNKEFNVIIEQQSGKEWFKTYSNARAKVQGRARNRFEFFIPPSAEDFVGLMYKVLPKGKNGDRALVWIKENLLDPYNKAEQQVIAAKISVANDFNELRNSIDNIPKNLQKQSGYSNFTWSQALRVSIWDMQGMDIPGLSVRDKNALVKLIEDNADMKVFAEKIAFIQKNKEYPAPGANWVGGSITNDIINSIQKTFRKQALQEWQQNVDIVFSEANMNKLEALYGSNYVVALKNILNRMKRGNNRPVSSSKQVENVIDWLNNSVGTIMFLNRKSALLQLISSINFINWSDNNIVAAGKAFANQPQYWKDVMYLMNSDYLVQRRNGMRINVAESEIADASKKGGVKGVIAYLLNKGFIFTRIADSLAIATGGATFYRNRVNSLQKQVNIDTGKLYTKTEAEAKAFEDFYQISEESQQSSRADRISMQQASGLGRLVLNFANTPMQYARIIKKSTKDLLAGRGDWKTNLSKILYYGAVQNLIFSGLQAALFTILFDEEEEKKDRTTSDKAENIGFSMLSSLLRGLGYGGALVDTIVAVSREIAEQQGKKSPDYEEAVWNVFDFSPAIDSKVRKLRAAANTFKFNRKEIARRGFSLENPAYLALGQFVSSTLNVPLDRALRMAMTLKQASDQDIALWQRIALIAGYSSWSVNLPYWGTTTTIEREAQEDEEIKVKYKKDTEKLKDKGFKRIPMTKGKPAGELGKDFITVTRPSGSIEYWLMPKK
jgi:hypothetical protein